jgi:histidyl-tRNA synthetase
MSLPRGFRDYFPEEFEILEFIRDKFVRRCTLYGFRLMEPSTLESLEVLEAKSGPSIREEIYFFRDKGGRDVGLRFDLTVGLTRYACSKRDLPLPIKLASFADVWRYDEPQRARYRWFYQWDVETYGPKGPEADAEIISFTKGMFEDVGLKDVQIKLGDRRMVQKLVEDVTGLKNSKVLELMRMLDKMDKKEKDALIKEYSAKGFSLQQIEEVLKLGVVEGDLNVMLSRFGEGSVPEGLRTLSEILKELEIKFTISIKVVRGLDYYTSYVFEVFDGSNLELGALAGGGRYDILPSIFGRPEIGATGIAGGVERLILALRQKKFSLLQLPTIYVAYIRGLEKEAFKLVEELRNYGFRAIVDVSRRSLSKQLEEADRIGSLCSILILPSEFKEEKVIVKDMRKKFEVKVEVKRLVDFLKDHI